MAVNLATAPRVPASISTLTDTYPHFFLQAQPKEVTSSSSSVSEGSTRNSTPTSPRNPQNLPSHLALQSRQLRPPKAPLYVPAVLRPTERPNHFTRKSNSTSEVPRLRSTINPPLTPPSSQPNSWEDKNHALALDEDGEGSPMLGDELSRTKITRIVTDEWNEDKLEPVTATPTKNHWKPDSSSPACDATGCDTAFSFLNRRHHCRRCGNIFCSPHSTYAVPLDQHARFHPQGTLARACVSCWADFSAWQHARKSRAGSIASNDSGSKRAYVALGGSSQAIPSSPKDDDEPTPQTKPSGFTLGSVPRGWNWSTF